MSQKRKALFEEYSDREDEDGELQINKSYANRYEEWRLSEELQKYKDQFGEDDLTSESSSEEDFAEADNPEFDREFLRAMGALHNKTDPKLVGVTFFTGDYSKKKEKVVEDKAMTIKDYERHFILEHGGELDENEEEGGCKSSKAAHVEQPPITKMSDLQDGLSSDDDDEGDALLTSGLFKLKASGTSMKQEKEDIKEREDAMAFIRGECSSVNNDEDKGLLEGLKESWNDPKKSEAEKWLIDFFVNERYNEDEDESKLRPYNGVVIDEESISDDEKTLEVMETFETKYRFRYEEPDEEFIKKYPRIIPDSLRAKDERRKLKRAALKERKQKEKEMKRQEIERLKALKYKEIEVKIEKIKEASGNQDIDLGDKQLDEDFDEAAHEQMMLNMFGDDYYAVDDGNTEKPVFSDDDLHVIKDYDDWLEKQDSGTSGSSRSDGFKEEEWDGSVDADYDGKDEARKSLQQEMILASSKTKSRRRKSKFAKAIKQKKPVFDPKEKNFESYFDEYYQLDYEDIVGDMPCRFKYRKVEPNDFGLSTEEILSAQDRELNRWASLKKMMRYNRDANLEQREHNMYKHRASHTHVKKKILPSLFIEDPVSHHISEEEKKRLKNLKKKLRRQQKLQENVEANTCDQTALNSHNSSDFVGQSGISKHHYEDDSEEIPKKKKKKKRKTDNLLNSDLDTVSKNSVGEDACNQSATLEAKQGKEVKENSQLEDTSHESTKQASSSPCKKIIENRIEESHPNLNTAMKKKKKKRKKLQNSDTVLDILATKDQKNGSSFSASVNTKKKKEKKPSNMTQMMKSSKNTSQGTSFFEGISDSRLMAYGENPKKIKNKVRYGKHAF